MPRGAGGCDGAIVGEVWISSQGDFGEGALTSYNLSP